MQRFIDELQHASTITIRRLNPGHSPAHSIRTFPIHLLLPFGSSLLVVVGLLLLRRAQQRGASSWTAVVGMSWACAIVFAPLLLLGGSFHAQLWWQPATVGILFLAGQFFTLLAVKFGDVSIATPVLGVKVLLVPIAAMMIVAEVPEVRVWVAASIAMVGIVLVQQTDATVIRSRVLTSIAWALAGAVSMTLFDLLIQRWAPYWGAGCFLPSAFAWCALFSLALLPWCDPPRTILRGEVCGLLVLGSVIMAVQAVGMTFTLAKFGDASRVNIVYSLRGMWGVLLTWWLLHRSGIRSTPGANSLRPSNQLMLKRFCGAVLIAISVIVVSI